MTKKGKRMEESEHLELKSSLSEWKGAVQTLAALSWAGGGKVVFGVSKSGKVIGVDMGKGTIEKLANDIKINTDPRIYPRISVEKVEGKNIILAEVEKVSEEPVLAFGRAYKRVGKSTHTLSREEYNRIILKKYEREYDGKICEAAFLKDIDNGTVKWFRKKYKEGSGKELYGSNEEILKSLGCIKLVNGKLRLTNAGILLFGKEPRKFFPRYYVTIARYPGKDIGTAYLEIKDIEGNLFKIIDKSDDYIKKHIETLYMLKEGQIGREPIPQYPDFVIRELITNAVAHRDYGIRGSKILIKIFKDRIEFDSPGSFPGNVNERNILEEQFSRNPIIVKTLNKIKYIEEMGEGWNRIFEVVKSHPMKFSKLPQIKGNSRVVATIFSPEIDERKEDGMARLWHDYGTIMARFTKRQLSAIEHVIKNRKITRLEYEKNYRISKRTAVRELEELVRAGVFEVRGKGPKTHYVLFLTQK